MKSRGPSAKSKLASSPIHADKQDSGADSRPDSNPKSPPGTTPFELSLLAAVISVSKGAKRTPEQCLADAQRLLVVAGERVGKGRLTEEMTRVLGHKPYTFDELLKPLPGKPAGKKPRTLLGAITTRQGLVKAIRRAFYDPIGRLLADFIIAKGEIQQSDLDYLQDDLAGRRRSRLKASSPKGAQPTVKE